MFLFQFVQQPANGMIDYFDYSLTLTFQSDNLKSMAVILRLHEVLKERALLQKEFAEKLGVS